MFNDSKNFYEINNMATFGDNFTLLFQDHLNFINPNLNNSLLKKDINNQV